MIQRGKTRSRKALVLPQVRLTAHVWTEAGNTGRGRETAPFSLMDYFWKEFFLAAGAGHMKENNYVKKIKDIDKSSIVCRSEDGAHSVDDWETGVQYSQEMNPTPKIFSFSFGPLRSTRPLNKS